METRSKKRKRQRLISITSHVSSWPDVPARFESLNDDTLTTILEFVGDKSYRSFGGLNYHCKEIYLSSKGMTKETFVYGYGPLSIIQERYDRTYYNYLHRDATLPLGKGVLFYNRRDVLAWALQKRKRYVLIGICNIAAAEGMIDLLDEVWNNVNDFRDKEDIFDDVDCYAARGGKLSVLKWFVTNRLSFGRNWCALRAATHGKLYYNAIIGGHLHVIRWLREEGVPWHEDTFQDAAEEGNLDILQWLHDEGCPWPDDEDYHVHESWFKPEVLVWCRSNGYGNRIIVG